MRLIDADKLKKHIRRCDDSATRATFDYVDEDDIDDMPTVDAFDKIRTEIDRQEKWLLQAGYTAYNVDIAFDSIKLVLAESEERDE